MFLKNKNIIFKIRRSKVTDYAALKELGKRDKMRGLRSILSLFGNELNKFNNITARMLDSFSHMTLRLL